MYLDVLPDFMKYARMGETSWKEIVVPNFLKFFLTGLTAFL